MTGKGRGGGVGRKTWRQEGTAWRDAVVMATEERTGQAGAYFTVRQGIDTEQHDY